jgi:hypothetical protein
MVTRQSSSTDMSHAQSAIYVHLFGGNFMQSSELILPALSVERRSLTFVVIAVDAV